MNEIKPIHRLPRLFQQCSRCILDTEGPHQITFDLNGVCNYCHEYDIQAKESYLKPDVQKYLLEKSISEIRDSGKGRKYDCIMGLSGGMDSSFIAYLAKKYQLKPLVVHLDNGWDSELAVKNIENILKKTGFDYYNYVINWEEFKEIQLSYLKASVIDVEVVSDQAIFAILHKVAYKYKIKNILFGDNPKTERIMPSDWSYKKNDLANLLAIHKKFGKTKIKYYPLMGQYDLHWYRAICGIRYISLMHYLDLNVFEMKKTLENEFGWKDYRWKHCESIFTRFYQGYILPKKNNADKRKAHLSDQILSGQISRNDALKRLGEPYYESDDLAQDYDFVIRKFGLTSEEFESILSKEPVRHQDFPTDQFSIFQRFKLKIWRFLEKLGLTRL